MIDRLCDILDGYYGGLASVGMLAVVAITGLIWLPVLIAVSIPWAIYTLVRPKGRYEA